jgi:sialic acid synthase SpsE
LVLLHCVSSYPTPIEQANLRAIVSLRRRYRLPVGYSDHTTTTFTGALALAAGAWVIEKHFTLDRRQAGPDHAMSLEPPALTEYVMGIRRAEAAMGTGRLACADIEQGVRSIARRSIVADRDIAAGQTLTSEMLSAKRPAGGIDPAYFEEVLGRRAACDIPRDTPLSWSMLHESEQQEVAPGA